MKFTGSQNDLWLYIHHRVAGAIHPQLLGRCILHNASAYEVCKLFVSIGFLGLHALSKRARQESAA